MTTSLSGYVTGVWPLTVVGDIVWQGSLRTSPQLAGLATSVGATFSDTGSTGVLHFLAYDSTGAHLAGVSVSTSAGGTIAYDDADAGSLATTPASTTASGQGYVFGLPAGATDLTFTASGLTCTASNSSGWPTTATGATVAVPIVAGQLTGVFVTCK